MRDLVNASLAALDGAFAALYAKSGRPSIAPERLPTTEVAQGFLSALLAQPAVKKLLSAEHFSVDGTMLKAFASIKSFRAKDGSDEPPEDGRNGERNFRKEKRSNETHASTTDPDARLYRKGNGQESRLAYLGHALMENRNGLAEGATLGADKGYDAAAFIEGLKERKIVSHVAINGTAR